ncbi:hypothetical protein AM588_10001068 [Phytophthora nicotianae]|uniref:GAF domain-containing protein n=1 Tax=Phytophthora nicotianae TaxID=4792 RepID=A0A0W8CP43_PHYNI|nr:hypothetical protein AM588_10001068 [Phytophthora nicotianae]
MPFKSLRRSPTLSTSYACTAASSPRDPSRKVLVEDEELIFRVHNANSAVALKRALTDPSDSWDSVKHTPCIRLGSRSEDESFELLSRAKGEGYEVLTVGSIACSPHELASLLCARDESEYNAAMKGLYGNQFIYGSVVQTLDGRQSQGVLPDSHQLAVRTGCFARSRMLARNEQWCFLEYFQPTTDSLTNSMSAPDTSQGFSVSLLSLSEQELAAGKAVGGRVDQLDGVTALLVVDTVPAVSKDRSDGKGTKLRVMFHALYKWKEAPVPGHASDKMARSRLLALAGGIPRLPAVIRRRRLGTQVFAQHDESTDNEQYMSAVEEYFDRRTREAPAVKDCVLSNAQQRNYPLHPMDNASPSAPVPENEVARLESIERLGLMDLKEPMPELDIICSFLSKELGFFCTMITIVGETHQLVLSCTIRDFVHAMLPREHTFCQHLLMGEAPFIIRHPEADVRFYNLNPVTRQGVKYYCGIPIVGPDGIMVGSICCVHSEAMDITRSQYDTLVRFGEIASKVIRVKAEAKLQSQ